jgi:hypothetical protein
MLVVRTCVPVRPRAASGAGAPQSRSIFIQVESTPNPDSVKFKPEGQIVLPEHLGNGMVGGAPCGGPRLSACPVAAGCG